MKYMFASDVHGSVENFNKLLLKYQEEKPDKLVLLGDLYYHGPRNPLTEGYYPMGVSELMNDMKNEIIAVRGNCDADIDVMISEFPITDERLLDVGDLRIFLTHGHLHDERYTPHVDYDVMIHGHTHVAYIERGEDGKIYANPGSIALPKDGNRAYLILENGVLSLKDLESPKVLATVKI